MTSAPSLAKLIGIAIATIAAATVGLPCGLAAQGDMPSAEEVREALQTLRRFERALATKDGVDLLEPRTIASSRFYKAEPLRAPSVGGRPSPSVVNPPASFALTLDGDLNLGGFIFKDEVPFLHNDGDEAYGNTSVGLRALSNDIPSLYGCLSSPILDQCGARNSAVGQRAMEYNTYGSANTAIGYRALYLNQTGSGNTAIGYGSLLGTAGPYGENSIQNNTAVGYLTISSNSTGSHNSALGDSALRDNTTGSRNTAIGSNAMLLNESGSWNTAIGDSALSGNTIGILNTGLGYRAGRNWDTGSYNIAVGYGSEGVAGETGTIRVGGNDKQSRVFIEGLVGTVTEVNDAIPVLIDSAGQLGTMSSSARVKEDIRDLDEASSPLLDLRPVTFRYRKSYKDGEKPIQFGLIAEEVAEVLPELVVYNDGGEPETVKYHLLSTLLLNELKKERKLNKEQQDGLDHLRRQMADRDRIVDDLSRRIERSSRGQ